jgi:hypothetical protein
VLIRRRRQNQMLRACDFYGARPSWLSRRLLSARGVAHDVLCDGRPFHVVLSSRKDALVSDRSPSYSQHMPRANKFRRNAAWLLLLFAACVSILVFKNVPRAVIAPAVRQAGQHELASYFVFLPAVMRRPDAAYIDIAIYIH